MIIADGQPSEVFHSCNVFSAVCCMGWRWGLEGVRQVKVGFKSPSEFVGNLIRATPLFSFEKGQSGVSGDVSQ